MVPIRNVTTDALVVPELGDKVVDADDTVEVPEDQADRYTCQKGVWEAVKQPKAAPKRTD